MKVNEAEEIIDNMYQSKMSKREENTKEGLTIHLGEEINFTKEEEASVIILRELQILRKKANKYDSLVGQIKEKAEELESRKEYLSKFNDWKKKDYTNEDNINNCIEVLQELLDTEK